MNDTETLTLSNKIDGEAYIYNHTFFDMAQKEPKCKGLTINSSKWGIFFKKEFPFIYFKKNVSYTFKHCVIGDS